MQVVETTKGPKKSRNKNLKKGMAPTYKRHHTGTVLKGFIQDTKARNNTFYKRAETLKKNVSRPHPHP
jgi:hypothetical protein